MSLPVAAVQFFATPFALTRNLQTAERLVRQAVGQGAQVVVLPAFFNTGYVYAPRLGAISDSDVAATLGWLTQLASELGILLGGAFLERQGDFLVNTFVLAEPTGALHRAGQRHPFLWEQRYFRAGTGPAVAQTQVGGLGLLAGWDAAYRASWTALAGADLILVSSAGPRLHRAVLNFPEAKKVYIADLVPEVLTHREALDDWFLGGLGAGAALANAPVVSATLAGRFVTQLPFPRLSFGLLALGRSRYLNWTGKAPQATLRATFAGTSAVFEASSQTVAAAQAEEAVVAGRVGLDRTGKRPPDGDSSIYLFSNVPTAFRRLNSMLSPFVKFFSKPISEINRNDAI